MAGAGAHLLAGQVARQAGVNRETLRSYERRGLLAAPDRSPGGHRVYADQAVTTLRIIKAAQRLGFRVEEIADLIDVRRHRHGQRPDPGPQARATAKLTEIDARIHGLQTIRANLTDAANAGCDDLTTCAQTDSCPIPFVDIAAPAPAEDTR
ncbi:MerR family transcriptional regulator [Flexivirga oryzae]|uniref:DNA-binding transcriptional MerR regulator n=1 Tax=Flexivirga oryzae TaxID=1794944 RepID=A0A839N7N4_9MICO|nr:MerR family transcriptional regulator [Flexivirga oryzae]MBB2892024.1 DNA-binding transcriptional MerR regulator [Flexivirga oryzae]